ncbi:DUF2927 domain-containing protein [Oceanomicrobium pacificus]|uniref:DUF2927 domain-containing protein n=1 Tax=Oceanomicrobium pacificus TaxID=2692916 RepID=A0A6B0U3E6_9RHOB|nr:DUF2927 domain-containing protein [Oceanomicrobium pacificus]MXU65481.1 DUF2927 domain-containing protein [Oceanomicrobium pacificus]
MWGRGLALALPLLAAACAELPAPASPERPQAQSVTVARFPTQIRPQGVARSNRMLANDILELAFQLENGDPLPGLLRYERPVRIALRSEGLRAYRPEIDGLIARLRAEAGIDIALTGDVARADMHIQLVPSAQMNRVAPGAACFIAPGVDGWEVFRKQGRRNRTDWRDLRTMGTVGIFIPDDSPPQEVRDCLHEEVAQALGPVNDVYRLSDTVFNDDNFHSVLTPFDMTVLRTIYQPEFRSGMPRAAMAAQLPRVLARTNPKGGRAPVAEAATNARWDEAIEQALDRRNRRGTRENGARAAVQLGQAMRPQDHRLGVSHLALGRLYLRQDASAATLQFVRAYDMFRRAAGGVDIRAAQAAMHLAVVALADGQNDIAFSLAEEALPAARAAENALLLSGLHAIQAAVFEARGQMQSAAAAQEDSLKWARFAFGPSSAAIREAQDQIDAFAEAALLQTREERP